MSKRSFIAACLTLVLLLAAMPVTLLANNGTEIPTQGLSFTVNQLDHLEIRLSRGSINVETHSDNNIRVVFYSPESGRYERPVYEFDSGTRTLTITEQTRRSRSIRNIASGGVTVYVPLNAGVVFDTATLRTTNGGIDILGDNVNLANRLNLRVTNGRVTVEDFAAGRAEISTTNSSIDARGLDINGSLTMRTTTGRIDLEASRVGGFVTARTVTGSITFRNVDADTDDANISSVTGRIRLD